MILSKNVSGAAKFSSLIGKLKLLKNVSSQPAEILATLLALSNSVENKRPVSIDETIDGEQSHAPVYTISEPDTSEKV